MHTTAAGIVVASSISVLLSACAPKAQAIDRPTEPAGEAEARVLDVEAVKPTSEVWSGCERERPTLDEGATLDVRALDWCETVIVPQFAVLHDGVAAVHDHFEGGVHAMYLVRLVEVAVGRLDGVDEETAVLLVHEDEHRDADGWSLGARLFVHVVRDGLDVRVATGPAFRGDRQAALRIEDGTVVVVAERGGQPCTQTLRVEGDLLVGDEPKCGP
jgi:hypothetical protein